MSETLMHEYTEAYVYYGTQLSTIIRSSANGSISLTFIYDDNGQALGFYYDTNLNNSNPGTKYYYVCNAQGDVLQLRDHTNAPVANYYYDSWGKLLGITDANGNAITAFNSVAVLNPIRYRGYFYDTETGFYYLNSRYYDPQIGRFINVDSRLNNSLGFLGYNLFTYCLNNPVNKVDYSGNKPGDLFDTMDEAARDFAEYINAKSIEDNREYASYIYTKTVTETRTTTYINPNIFGNNPLSWLWNVIFGGGLTKTVTTKVKITKYTYREPKRGTVDSSSPPINWFGIHTVVGRLHTHAAYDPAYANDIFSPADKRNAERQGVPTYVATPLGTLRKYDPSNGTDIVLFNDIPFDPNHPER